MTSFLDMPSVYGTEELPYVLQLKAIKFSYADLRNNEFTTHNRNYVALPRPFDRHVFLKDFEFWMKEMVFKRRSQLKSTDPLFVNLHCADFFDIPLTRGGDLFVQVPEK